MKIKIIPALVLSLVLMPIIAVLVLTWRGSFQVKDLAVLGEVNSFELTERSGEKRSSKDLKNKVWVLSFFCTSCNDLAPLVALESQKISKALLFKENFRMVTVTLDPERDTEILVKEFASEWKADPFKWWFLRGDSKEIEKLKAATPEPASQFALIDHLGRIRGHYELQDSGQMKQILKEAKRLLKKAY